MRNWQHLRLRLERSRAALDQAFVLDPQHAQRVYRERAARLAKRPVENASAATLSVLVFQMGNERYGIELRHLAEVIPHPLCARVPGAPPRLAGVLQVRGEIRPVWELARVLGLPDLVDGDLGCVLLLRKGSGEVGFRVGQVEGTRISRPEECSPPPGDSRYVKLITPDLIAILDPEKLFDD